MTARPEGYLYNSYRQFIFSNEETIVFRDLIWDMISKDRKSAPQGYREFVESAFIRKSGSPFEKVYGGVVLGGDLFIKQVLQRVNGQSLRGKEVSCRKVLSSTASDRDEIIHLLSTYFKVSKEKVISSPPYKAYAVYLVRKHTPCSNVEIGNYFGGITYSAVTKIGTRFKERMRGDENLKREIEAFEKNLSRVKG